jgi:hypothetical protein
MPNFAMLNDPSFWSWLSLLTYLIWLHHQQHKTKRQLVEVVGHDQKVIEQATEIISRSDSFGQYMSGQADITIHHGAELQRVRESLLELAADVNRVESSVSTLSAWPGPTDRISNRVFERHSELPGEFPKDIRDSYLSGGWTCPNCGARVPHNWVWWCKSCQRRTFPPVAGIETYPPTDHEPTQPGGICDDDNGGAAGFTSNDEPPTSPNRKKEKPK